LITLLSDTAYHSFIGEVEALNTTTIRRLTRSRRHQLLAIAPADGSKVYVANFGGNTVSVIDASLIDTANNPVIATIAVGSAPYGVAVTSDGSKVYVANFYGSTVSVIDASLIDTANNPVIATIAVGSGPLGLAVTPDGTKVYVANGSSNTVSVINTANNNVTGPPISVGDSPYGVAVTRDGGKVYVDNRASRTVSVIATGTDSVTDTISVGGFPMGLAVAPDASSVYVTDDAFNTVSVIDTTMKRVTDTISVGSGPTGLAVTPDGSKVYVANASDNTVSVVDTTLKAVTDTIVVGTTPIAFGIFIQPGPSCLVAHPCIVKPSDGASPLSQFVALSGTGSPGDVLDVLVNDVSVGSVVIDSEGYWEALPDLLGFAFVLIAPTIQVQDRTTAARSNIINLLPHPACILGPGPCVAFPQFLPLRSADILTGGGRFSPQTPLYGPQYTHTALYLGGDVNGTPILAEAVTPSEAGTNGQVRNLPLEQSLMWTYPTISGFTPVSPLSNKTRHSIVGYATSITEQGLPYWNILNDFDLILFAERLYVQFGPTNSLSNRRFISFVNAINTDKNSTNKFICSTLVWRSYLEGSGGTLDISNPNNMVAAGIMSTYPSGFIDLLRPVFIVPDTFALSPYLTKIF
jgi:YVTN family beta-propeller protein